LRCDAYVKSIVSENIRVKSDKYKFMKYPKETIGYYLYHLVEKTCLSQNMLPF
jgi:hypothetical protein